MVGGRKLNIIIKNANLMVRVGGGWVTFNEYVEYYLLKKPRS